MVAGLALAFATAAHAKTAAERLADFDTSFKRTGEVERCLSLHRIHDTRIIDERHILFRIDVSHYYLNTLPRACTPLNLNRGFVIRTRLTKLCDVDWITVIEPPFNRHGHFQGPVCGLGHFERVEKIGANE